MYRINSLVMGEDMIFGFRPDDVPQSEANALISFYNATDGDNWTTNTGWCTDTTVGNWHGVTVSGGHVTELDLVANGATVSGAGAPYLAALTELTRLYLNNTSVSGDISGFSVLTGLTYLNVYNTSVSGDISGFSALTGLTYLNVYNTSVSGNISGFSVLTDLTSLNIGNNSVSGDISGFSALTDLTILNMNTTSVSGDAGFVASLPNLAGIEIWKGLRLDNTSISDYTSAGNLPAWSCNINVSNLGWDQSEVNAFLQDLDGGGGIDGMLNIAGTNAAPGWGDETDNPHTDTTLAVVSLLEKGWDITVTGDVPTWVEDMVGV